MSEAGAMIRDIPIKVILILGFLVSGIVPLLIAFLLSYSTAQEELKKQAFMQLESVRDIKKRQVERFYEEKAGQLQALAMNPAVAGVVAEFARSGEEGAHAQGPDGRESRSSGELQAHAAEVFRFSLTQPGWENLYLMDGRHGDRYFSVRDGAVQRGPDRGADHPLRRVWAAACRGEAALSDTCPRAPDDRRPIQLLAVPVRLREGETGVMAAVIALDQIDRIMGERSGMGVTGESYLVGPDLRMRSGSYLDRQGRSVEASFRGTIEANGVDTRASRGALDGATRAEILTDYRGQSVLSAYAPVQFFGLRWAVIAEIDEREIDQRIAAGLDTKVLVILGASVCLVLVLALSISQVITGSIRSFIRELDRLIGQVLQGRLGVRGDPQEAAHDFRGVMHQANALIAALARYQDEKRQLEEAVQFNQRMESIGTLAGGIAHDFNNILCYMLAYADLVQAELPPGTTTHENLAEVITAIERAGELVSQILTFSRQVRQEKKPLRVALIVKEAAKLLKATLPKTIQVRKEIIDEDLYVLADPIQFHQILMNLCTNSFQAMQDHGGVLTIRLDETEGSPAQDPELPPGRYCRLTVIDTGIGMDEETRQRMFEPFFTTKPVGQGTGMGLAVVHGIVSACGGGFRVQTRAGVGTTIEVLLPLAEPLAESAGEEADERVEGGTGTVLFVDDEPHICRATRGMLEALGYSVRTAGGGREALAVFAAAPEQIDGVITDIQMPEMSGLELLRHLQVIRPGIPVVLLTGYSEMMDGARARALGAAEMMQKPFTRSQLAAALRRILHSAQGPSASEGVVQP
jgi:signal transduction histidine kinase/CheY-like chemotaxis protein